MSLNILDRVEVIFGVNSTQKGTVVAIDHHSSNAFVKLDGEPPGPARAFAFDNLIGLDPCPVVAAVQTKDLGCEHDWVTYQPFRGEPYLCCSKGGCGITYVEYLDSKSTVDASHDSQLESWEALAEEYAKVAQTLPIPKVPPQHKKGWTPVSLTDYMAPLQAMPTGLSKTIQGGRQPGKTAKVRQDAINALPQLAPSTRHILSGGGGGKAISLPIDDAGSMKGFKNATSN